ncbi:MAG TPA: spermidine synthase [Myxococcaceae bacterium]|nr:spermidine synthase [Myxococcaceae bacterium]
MRPTPWKLAPLLFGSGLCALIYQVAWFREFRLVFGASTLATSAVLAIFIGGLGLGGLYWGPRADRTSHPLWLYARLEIGVALTSAVTPGLLWLVRAAYLALGGQFALGAAAGTVLRLVLAALVLAPPTLLMGGTLPAVVRAAQSDEDAQRRGLGLLYGANTLGAVAGAFSSSFALLEVLGTRQTLWTACLLNLLVAMVARVLSRRWEAGLPPAAEKPAAAAGEPATGAAAPERFVLVAAAVVGFAFFLLEIVWYRMLGPLLGGTVFTFGLILSFALLGIGAGGALYGRPTGRRPALSTFAVTCLLEALAVAVPFALGDRLAVAALFLRQFGSFGFSGFVLGWSVIAAVVVLPAALVAGYQFPLLIALLGRGRREVGRQIGLTYAWNTAGSMVGSLAGGFGLLPLLGAPALWRFTAAALALLGACAVALGLRAPGPRGRSLAAPVALLVPTVALLMALGPTAMWRHSGIGAGRVQGGALRTTAEIEELIRGNRRVLVWEADGLESSVAALNGGSLALVVNGKSDGEIRSDASTMIMGGLLGALLHPREPKRGLIVGLGTGSSGGWLSEVPGMDVDVVELERAVEEVALRCGPLSRWTRDKPHARLTIADAREFVLASREKYDVVMAEPSNPYRAGVASLFTVEYYRALADKMADDALFAQWVQAYEIDADTLRTVFASVSEVFPWVETWEVGPGDLILLASKTPQVHDVERLRRRVQQEPYKTALFATWRADTAESVLAHCVAGPAFARALKQVHDEVNTDDRTVIEFAFARQLGQRNGLSTVDVMSLAVARGEGQAEVKGAVDWSEVSLARAAYFAYEGRTQFPPGLGAAEVKVSQPWRQYTQKDARGAAEALHAAGREPKSAAELQVVAQIMASAGDEAAVPYLDKLRAQPSGAVDADLLTAVLRGGQGKPAEAAHALSAGFIAMRANPWATPRLAEASVSMAGNVARDAPDTTRELLEALSQPFSVNQENEPRVERALQLALREGSTQACLRALEPYAVWPPFSQPAVGARFDCYRRAGDPRAAGAERDLDRWLELTPVSFDQGLAPTHRPGR